MWRWSNFSFKSKLVVLLSFWFLFFIGINELISNRITTDYLSGKLTKQLEQEVSLRSVRVGSFFDEVASDVEMFAYGPLLKNLIETDSDLQEEYQAKRESINIGFQNVVKTKSRYQQLRYINERGIEVVRVDRVDGQAVVRSISELQYKGDRYYFSEASKLPKGQLYISEIDLNKEGTPPTIETPHNPVVRYALTVHDQNNRFKGIVIANVSVEQVINEAVTRPTDGDLFLLDSQGFYIYNQDSQKTWGSPRDLNTGYSFQNDFPGLAEAINESSDETLIVEDKLFSHQTVYLNDEIYLTILEIVSVDQGLAVLSQISRLNLVSTLVEFAGLLVIILLLVWRLLRPLDNFLVVAEKLAHGNWSARVREFGSVEFSKLSTVFNHMADKLQDVYRSLDEKVKQQTQDLQNKMQQIEDQKEGYRRQLLETRKFQEAVDLSTEAVVITTPEPKVIYTNNKWQELTGYSESEALGKNPNIQQSGQTPKRVYKEMWKTIKGGEAYTTEEIVNKTKKGRKYHARLSIYPIIEKGEIVFYVGVQTDITTRVEVDKAKTEFVSLASHQLRTPLSSINWYSEMLINGDMGKLNKDQKKYMKQIYDSNQKMIDLVNSLLNVSRLELGTLAISPKEVDMKKIAKELYDELKPDIKSKSIKYNFSAPKKVPKLKVDPQLARIVVQNLLTNAIKYTPIKGQVEMRYKINYRGKKVKANGFLVVEVEDTGYGIPQSQQDEIFDKLFRADNVKKMDTEGTGLGLYLVKKILEQSGGWIEFESEEDKGSLFRAAFPLTGMKAKEGTKKLSENK